MTERRDLTAAGAASVVGIMLILALNQVVIKLTNDGLQPVFSAGVRSAGAALVIWGWMRLRGQRLDVSRGTILSGLVIGVIFAAEFVGLFVALDLSTVSRVSVIFYSMPVWLAVAAHFLLPGERLTALKTVGLVIAFAGVAWAILDRSAPDGSTPSIWGDLAALLAMASWMGVSLMARLTPLARVTPEMQMFWQVAVSTPILLALAPLFGPFVRDFQPVHIGYMAYQIVLAASFSFVAWFMLLARFKASAIASFAFLSPVLGVALGWLILDEPVGPGLILKLALVALGIILINRRPRVPA